MLGVVRPSLLLALAWIVACASEVEVLDAGTDASLAHDAEVLPDADAGPSTCTTGVSPPLDAPHVTLERGFVRGVAHPGGAEFLGIPFASPPVGARRWRRPVAPEGCFDEVLQATSFGPKCPQIEDGNYVGDEDCLQLNVWTPSLEGEAKPVLFFIHGGGNALGSTSQLAGDLYLYEGRALASRGEVVAVTASYRIGQLGWMSDPALDEEGHSGNYGLYDLVLALEWVRDNIEAFGGDPDRILVFGESAGAVNTCLLLASPLTEGLISAALVQSGGCPSYAASGVRTESAAIISDLGCANDVDPASCLRAVDAETVIRTRTPAVDVAGAASRMQPFVDGHVLPTDPLLAIEQGPNAEVPLIVGANTDETSRSVPAIQTEAQYETAVRSLFPTAAVANLVLAQYPASRFATPRAALVRLTTDAKFVCSSRTLLRARVRGGRVAYRYVFGHALDSGPARAFGAWHGLELTFVFGHLMLQGYEPSEAELRLSETMQDLWASFARSGTPSAAGAPAWPRYEEVSDPYLLLEGAGVTSEVGFRTEDCDFWEQLLR